MPSYNARFIPNSCLPNGDIREHCSAQRDQITTTGRKKGQQVRVERYTPDGLTLLEYALYTVVALHDEEPDLGIEVKIEDCLEGFNGNDAKNVVNRLGANGIHIEQPSDARTHFGRKIAEAVADVIGRKI